MSKPMSNEEYLEAGGNECPFCGSRDIAGGPFASDCDYAWRSVDCNTCEKSWTENFKMTGYEKD